MGDNVTNTTQQTAGASAQTQTGSSQVVKDPYAATLPYLQQLTNEAQNQTGQQNATIANAFGNSYQAPYNMAQYMSQAYPEGLTPHMYTEIGNLGQISGGQQRITTEGLYNQIFNQAQPLASNTSGALTETQQAILDQNSERLGNRLASQYSGAGRYGSFGAGIGLARGIAETNNPLMAQYNQQNIGNSLAAMGIQGNAAGGMTNVQQQNIGNRMNAANMSLGAQQQGMQQAQNWLNMQPALFNMATQPYQQPWKDIQNQTMVAQGVAPYLANAGTVTTNSNAQMTGTNTGTTNGETSQPTPWTTFAGLGLAGVGALGRISDRRMKTDIKKVGKDPWTDLNMYQWRYKGQPKSTPKFVGPMAQEVQKVFPEAVGELPSGILYIKKAA